MAPVLTTLAYPVYDEAPKHLRPTIGNMHIPSMLSRVLKKNTRCLLLGHNWQVTGYANSHKYSWHEWKTGDFMMCKSCFMRKFEKLESQAQLDDVLSIERNRWRKHWKERSAQENNSRKAA